MQKESEVATKLSQPKEKRVITNVFNPKWYVEQMQNWTFKSYLLLMFGLGFIIATTLSTPMTPFTIITMMAGLLGFTCTLSITNAKPLNGVFGAISAMIYIYVAWQSKNYSDAFLQLVYILALDLPVLVLIGWSSDVDKKVKGLGTLNHGLRNRILTLFTFLAITGALYVLETSFFDSPRPFIDSLAAGIGITGAILTTLRFKESYYFWLIQGILSIILWGVTMKQGGNPILFMTYVLYLSNDLIAFFDKDIPWFHKDNKKALLKAKEDK